MVQNEGLDRRTVLKRLGATAAAGVAVSGTATASDGKTWRAKSLDDVDVDRLFATEGAELLELLTADDVLEDGVRELSTTAVDPRTDSSHEGASAYVIESSEASKTIVTTDTHVNGGRLEATVELETGNAYATLTTDDGRRVRYTDIGDEPKRTDLGTDSEPCCKCCVCPTGTAVPCTGDFGPAVLEECYGPADFGCPFAYGDCVC